MKLSLRTISYNLAYLLCAYHLFILFNPCVKVKSWACQYFSLSHKTVASSTPLTRTCSISCTCKYSVLHVADLQTFKRRLATPHLILPVLMSFLWIWNLYLKPVAEPIYCLPQHFMLSDKVKEPLILYWRLVAWQVNSVDNTRKFLQILDLLLHFSID